VDYLKGNSEYSISGQNSGQNSGKKSQIIGEIFSCFRVDIQEEVDFANWKIDLGENANKRLWEHA